MSAPAIPAVLDPMAPHRTDAAIWTDLQTRIEDVIRKLCWYHVQVHEGVATFTGPDDALSRLLLLNLARNVSGVRHIRFDPP